MVTAGPGPVLVIAGAGSGKTRTLVHRVAWLLEQGVEADSILLLTFTRRAAQEMLQRAHHLHPLARQVSGGTFHSLCHRLLRQYASHLNLPRNFTVLDRADGEHLLRAIINDKELKEKGDKHFPKAGTVLDLISKARNQELSLEDAMWQHASHLGAYLEPMETMAKEFAAQKLEQGLVDYDDLLYFTQDLLIANHDIKVSLNQRWQHLLVDEYQDTNAVQDRLVSLLAGGHRSIMVVGDDAQSIYRFRGARIENILQFPQKFKKTRVVKLEENYRSPQSILDLTNHIISESRQGFAKKLYSERKDGHLPKLLRPLDEREQTRQVLEQIESLLGRKTPLRQIAVLFRSAYDSFHLEVELNARKLPFVKVGGFRFLESSHIKDALSHLRVLANPLDFVSWQRLLMLLPGVGAKKAQGISARLAQKPENYLAILAEEKKNPQMDSLIQLLGYLNTPQLVPVDAARAVIEYYEPICTEQYEDYPRRLRDLAEIPALAANYDELLQFMAEVALEPPNTHQPDYDQYLTLSTVHSAKGLEWDHVFILWADQGRFPPGPALLDPEAMEEERRLMYVACTRAAQSLTILAPMQYYSQGQGLSRMALSSFLEDVPRSLVEAPKARIFNLPPEIAASAKVPLKPDNPEKESRPFKIGAMVRHHTFGKGKVMGYKGPQKILVHFERLGLKILLLEFAGLEADV